MIEETAAAARRIGMEMNMKAAANAAQKYLYHRARSEFYMRAAMFRSRQRRRKRV